MIRNQKARGENMIKKICTHPEPRHLDDFLAVSFLKTLFPEAEIEYVHPQKVPHEYVTSPEILLVDVGHRYEPERGNFDHHQSINVPCSLILVLNSFSDDVSTSSPIIKIIDYIDRFGFEKASKKFNLKRDEKLAEKLKIMLYADITKHFKEITRAFLRAVEHASSYEEFILSMYTCLKSKGILDDAVLKFEREEREFEEKAKQVKILHANQLTVAVSFEPIREVHKLFSRVPADILISPGIFDPEAQTAIIKNTSSPLGKIIDLKKLATRLPVKTDFVHHTGFLLVAGKPIQEIDIDEILRCVCSLLESKEIT